MGKIGLIIEREYLTRVYKKSFIIMTLVIPFIFILVGALPLLLSQIKDKESKNVAVIDETGLYSSLLKSNESFTFVPVQNINETPLDYYKEKQSDLYAILMISGNLINNPNQITIFSEKTISNSLKKDISSQLNPYLTSQKIDSYDIPDLKEIINSAQVNIDIQTVKWNEAGDETKSSAEVASAIGMASTMLIYIFIFAYGGMVLQGVMQEKTNRIVEVMVSSVKPFELMMGKIIGVGFVGLTQFLIWVLLIGAGFAILGIGSMFGSDASQLTQAELSDAGFMESAIEILAGVNYIRILLFFLLYFIGGYLLYASIFAAIGSMVDQEADTQQFMIPVTMIIMFAFYAAIYSIENPDGPLAFWCSVIPFTSPIVMMVRLPYDVPVWQLILSIVMLFGTFVGLTFIAAKIYRTGILMYGKKVTWKEAVKWLRY